MAVCLFVKTNAFCDSAYSAGRSEHFAAKKDGQGEGGNAAGNKELAKASHLGRRGSGPSACLLSGTRRAKSVLLRKAPNVVNDRIQSETMVPANQRKRLNCYQLLAPFACKKLAE